MNIKIELKFKLKKMGTAKVNKYITNIFPYLKIIVLPKCSKCLRLYYF